MNYGRVYRNSFVFRWNSFEASFYLEHEFVKIVLVILKPF